MSRVRHTAGVLALVAAAATACADPQTPLPVQAASAEPAVEAGQSPAASRSSAAIGTSPPTVRPPATRPTRTRTTRPGPGPTSDSTCLGAVRYDLDLQNTVLDLQTSMCFHTGGVLRIFSIGPGLVESGPSSVVSESYEAAVVTLRFIRAGTATVTIPQEDRTHTITVVVRA